MSIATIAQAEFDRRRAVARGKLESGEWTRAGYEEKLCPWLAIAILAGATPDVGDLASLIRENAAQGVPEPQVREGLAGDVCDPAEWQAALVRARDAALARTLDERATGLVRLASHLGAGAPVPRPAGSQGRPPARCGPAACGGNSREDKAANAAAQEQGISA